MGVNVGKVSSSSSYVTAVVEYGETGLDSIYRFTNTTGVVCVYSFAKLSCVFVVVGVFSLVKECLYAVLAPAGTNTDYVKKDSVTVIVANYLFNLCDKVVEIGRVHAKLMITRSLPVNAVVFRSSEPFGVTACDFFVKACGKIYGSLYSYLVSGFDFGTEQVKIKSGVHFVCGTRVICPSVVAF